jgi:hypothetical protein
MPTVVDVLASPQAILRRRAAMVLGELMYKAVFRMERYSKECPEHYGAAESALITALGDSDAEVRGRAARAQGAVEKSWRDSRDSEDRNAPFLALLKLLTHEEDLRVQAVVLHDLQRHFDSADERAQLKEVLSSKPLQPEVERLRRYFSDDFTTFDFPN